MRNNDFTYRRSFLVAAAILGWMLTLLPACDMVSDVVGPAVGVEELPEGDPPRDNASDEQSSEYNPPELDITITPAIADGEINDHQIEIEWQPIDYDETKDVEVRYRLVGFSEWASWNTDQRSVIYQYLDEESYTFQIEAKYPGKVEPEFVQTQNFRVRSINGPALKFTPRKQLSLAHSQAFEVEIYLQYVSDVNGVKAVIEYNPRLLRVRESVIYIASNNFLSPNGGEILRLESPTAKDGRLIYNVSNLDEQTPEVNGSGAVGRIDFQVISDSTAETSIRFSEQSRLRDAENQDVEISTLVPKFLQLNMDE